MLLTKMAWSACSVNTRENDKMDIKSHTSHTLPGTNKSDLGKRKIIIKSPGDGRGYVVVTVVPRRVFEVSFDANPISFTILL